MATYKQLQDQIKQLQNEAEELRKNELSNAISQIKMTMAEYGITLADLGFTNKKKTGRKKSDACPRTAGSQIPQSGKWWNMVGSWQGSKMDRPEKQRQISYQIIPFQIINLY